MPKVDPNQQLISNTLMPADLPKENFFVNEYMNYPGRFVNKRIERVIGAVKVNKDRFDKADRELVDLYNDFNTTVQVTVNTITALASVARWDALKAWLGLGNIFNTVVGEIKKFNDAVQRQNNESIFIIDANSPQLAVLNTQLDTLLRRIDDFENDRIDGQALMQFIVTNSTNDNHKRIFANMRRYIDLGGSGVAPVTIALYNLAYPIWEKRGDNRWSAITKEIWKGIENKPHLEMTVDEQTVYEEWVIKTFKNRKEQVRNLFRDKVGKYGI